MLTTWSIRGVAPEWLPAGLQPDTPMLLRRTWVGATPRKVGLLII